MIADALPSEATAAIRLDNVSKVFHHGEPVTILDAISLNVSPGSYTALMGPSGAGKSTLLNIIGCLSQPTSGTVLLSGRDVTSVDEQTRTRIRRDEIGFVFQSFQLIPHQSALRNVAFPLVFAGVSRQARHKRARSLLERVGLEHRLDYPPEELSAGQRQRVAIARALANDPTILLADEPTGSLDQKTGERILDLLDEFHSEGQTVFVVTHDSAVAARADRVVRIQDGTINTTKEGVIDGRP
ncbi:putative ABC transport system ATP-binding protein [Halogranum amylolyticum]|uniref:Putative ABC transport system ATP-binding protein n=1 Tax=Halogranum amylolyticum TaxID=660520 RepID=A0A1H8WT75_9EURY|nr:ABC transporter ATP-binding protein [Halogranum amylolyticum]SEP30278.1 putative ABC transport system ATP-binding protein [Halogranum amylolyticum]